MDATFVLALVMAVANLLVMAVGGAWAVSKMRTLAEVTDQAARANHHDIAEIKQAVAQVTKKLDVYRDLIAAHGERLAKLEGGGSSYAKARQNMP